MQFGRIMALDETDLIELYTYNDNRYLQENLLLLPRFEVKFPCNRSLRSIELDVLLTNCMENIYFLSRSTEFDHIV